MRARLLMVDGHALTDKTGVTQRLAARFSAAGLEAKTYLCQADTDAPSYVQMMQPALDNEAWVILCSTWRADYVREELGLPTFIPIQTRRMLDRLALGCSAHIALCQTTLDGHGSDDESREMIRRIAESWVVAPTGGIPMTTVMAGQMEPWDLDLINERMDRHIDKTINQGPGVGAWRPGQVVLLVGDKHGPSLQPYKVKANIAFCDMAKAGSSYWLTNQLHQAGIPEEQLYWINSFEADGTPTDHSFVERLKPITVLAMGDSAARWARSSGIRYEAFTHPQYHKRFKSKEDYPLIQRLSEIFADWPTPGVR